VSRADGRVIPKSQVGTDGDLLSQRVVDPPEADKRRAGIALVEAWQRSDTSTWADVVEALQMLGIAPS
jgi:hypothetical protein